MDSDKPNAFVGSDTDIADEAAARVASSPGPVSEQASDFARGEQESQPLSQDAVDGSERGADQDPDIVPGPGPDAAAVDVDIEALAAKAGKADEYLELAQRTKADFENFRKRAAREAALAQDRGVAKLAKELLPAVDNLDRALQAAEAAGQGENGGASADATLASGIKLVHADVIAALARVGIEPYSPEGELFDPQHHEAIAQHPVEGAPSGTVVEVYQSGYRLGEQVLRPARVVVAA
jgi:molecular chaperone GrpE